MEVYSIDKKSILTEYDLTRGYLKDDVLVIEHPEVPAQEEQGHYETLRTYPNGGKDVEWVVTKEAVEHQEAYTERKEIRVFIPYTEEELRLKNIEDQIEFIKGNILRQKELLASTDYKALKYAEGWITEEDYADIKAYRQNLRVQINELEADLAKMTAQLIQEEEQS